MVGELTIILGAKTDPVPRATPCTLGAGDFSRTSVPHDATSSPTLHPRCRFLPTMEGLREGGRISSTDSFYQKPNAPTLKGGEIMQRCMRNSLVATLALCAIVCLPGMAGAITTLYFDDITTPGGVAALPTIYGGFNWSASGETGAQWEVINNGSYQSWTGGFYNFPI